MNLKLQTPERGVIHLHLLPISSGPISSTPCTNISTCIDPLEMHNNMAIPFIT